MDLCCQAQIVESIKSQYHNHEALVVIKIQPKQFMWRNAI